MIVNMFLPLWSVQRGNANGHLGARGAKRDGPVAQHAIDGLGGKAPPASQACAT
jgi:hypothetical protein